MRRVWLAAMLLLVCAQAAHAQTTVVEGAVNATPGRDVRFGVYSDIRDDCTSGPLPAIKLVTAPEHGSVVVKRGTLRATNVRQCLATEVPVFVGFYRAAPNFSGSDEFELEVSYPGGRKEVQRFRVSISGGERPI